MTSVPAGRVLIVCTGNVCRSPFIEYLLRSALGRSGFVVESAGTAALDGARIDPGSGRLLNHSGVDSAAFIARQLTPELVARADLLIGAEREHVSQAVRMYPRALRRSFALGDLAALLGGPEVPPVASPNDLAATGAPTAAARVAALALSLRGAVPPRTAADVAIHDPIGRGEAAFTRMADQVAELLPPVVAALHASRTDD